MEIFSEAAGYYVGGYVSDHSADIYNYAFYTRRAVCNKQVSEEVEAALNAKYNLDAPLYEQFFSYLKNILHGDFGPSYKYTGKTVNDFIYSGFPVSGRLGLVTIIFVLLAAIPMGILAAIKNGKWRSFWCVFNAYGSRAH